MLGVSQSRGLKLFGREIIFEEFQPMCSRYLIVTDGQTDRQLTVASPRSALASRGKNSHIQHRRLYAVTFCRSISYEKSPSLGLNVSTKEIPAVELLRLALSLTSLLKFSLQQQQLQQQALGRRRVIMHSAC